MSILFLLSLASLATCSFNLNTIGEDWSYTANDLSNTTSQACKDAYSAEISCDYTLVGLVASMRPAFKPTSSDFDNTCTSACSDSVKSYVDGVNQACTADGDKAQLSLVGGLVVYEGGTIPPDEITLVPVGTVGEVFQYTFAQWCRKDDNNGYCYFSTLAYGDTIECTDTCSLGFFQTAHNYPGSAWTFIYYWLISRSSWWEGAFSDGWARVEECEYTGGALSTGLGISGTEGSSTSSSSWVILITIPPTPTSSSETVAKTTPSGSTIIITSTEKSASTSTSTSKSSSETSASAKSSQTAVAPSSNAGPALPFTAGELFGGVMALCLWIACF